MLQYFSLNNSTETGPINFFSRSIVIDVRELITPSNGNNRSESRKSTILFAGASLTWNAYKESINREGSASIDSPERYMWKMSRTSPTPSPHLSTYSILLAREFMILLL